MQSPEISQRDLAVYINKHYDPLRIAESIATHEFFQSEPLIAVREGEHFRVIEGNRRLTALKGLADENLRDLFGKENKGWKNLAASYPTSVPVLIVEDERSVAPLLGYRHISGIEPWEPYAQARYIAKLVEEVEDIGRVAELVGREVSEVRAMYRDHEILAQAEFMFKLDATRARAAFGVFANAMARRGVQSYISAPQPRFVKTDEWPIPTDKEVQLRELLNWIFGGSRGDGRVINDSRQLGELARVLQNAEATRVLRESGNLVEAHEALADPEEQFQRSATRVLRELEKMSKSTHELSADEVAEFLRATRDFLTTLEAKGKARS